MKSVVQEIVIQRTLKEFNLCNSTLSGLLVNCSLIPPIASVVIEIKALRA